MATHVSNYENPTPRQDTGKSRRLAGLVLAGLFAPALAAGANSAYAQAGSLDPSFGTGGKAVTNFGVSVQPAGAAVDANGNIIVAAGFSHVSIATEAFGVVRYRSSGRVDTSFGNGGSAIAAFTNFINSPNAMALQPDGKIVVVGEARSADGTLSEFAIARFTANGALDSSFGRAGQVTTNFVGVKLGGVRNSATAVLIQPDGKLLVGGVASQCGRCVHNTALARYNTNGTLDAAFGNGGEVSVNAIGAVGALALLSSGDILAVNNTSGALAQFTAQGALASSPSSGTIVASSVGSVIAFQPDSKIILAQTALEAASGYRSDIDVKVVRFNPSGGVDLTFASPLFDFGPEDRETNAAQAVVLDSNWKVLAGGYSGTSSPVFGLARLNTDGSLDSSFGNGGKVTTRFNGLDLIWALVVQSDGKILAIGETCPNGSCNLALARYLAN